MKKVLSIMLAFVLIFSFAGCGGEAPQKTVEKTLNAIKAADSKKASAYIDYNKLVKITTERLGTSHSTDKIKLIFANLQYKVISSSTKGNSATVKVKITNTDMSAVMANLYQEAIKVAMSSDGKDAKEKKMFETYQNLMDHYSKSTVDNTVSIQLLKLKGKWQIQSDDALTNAILGGLIKSLDTNSKTNTTNGSGSNSTGSATSASSAPGSQLAQDIISNNTDYNNSASDTTSK